MSRSLVHENLPLTMDNSFSSLIFGIADHPAPDANCYMSNYQDHSTDWTLHSLDHPAYDHSPDNSMNALENYPSGVAVANASREISPYNSPNLSTEESENENDPFSQRCRIPVPNLFPITRYQMWLETSFMCKRNERERQRVRNVNDGFSRLRNHLPRSANMRRRQSKVETLQHAIKYIKHLQSLLEEKDVEKNGQT